MRTEGIDNSSSILLPYYDQDTKIMYLAGKVKIQSTVKPVRWQGKKKSFLMARCKKKFRKYFKTEKKNLSTKNHLLEWQIRKNQGTKTRYKNCTPQPSNSHCNQMFIIIHTY